METTEDERIALVLSEIQRLQDFVSAPENDWSSQIPGARSLILDVSSTTFMQQADRQADRIRLVRTLQKLAYFDPDSGGVQDIAEWCVAQWLRVLQHDAESIDALQGLGQSWLSQAQSALARIHRQEGSPSSGSSNPRPGTGHSMTYTSSDEARDAAQAIAEADGRVHTADYVEARGMLLPSTEYFCRAVTVAERKGSVTGSLLAAAAEAHMSLGNVSYSHGNEPYFRQALIFLRKASQLPGYTLSPYLQHYLNDYGRLLD